MGIIKIPNNSFDFFKSNLNDIIDSGNLAEGKWNKNLSKFVKDLTGAKTATVTNSNGAGLVGLMSIFRHYHNRTNVLIQENTMYGVKAMVYASGCNVVGYTNCKIETLMPSIDDVKNAVANLSDLKRKNLVFLISHIGGIINPDIKLIAEFCKKENIILFEDCAHSFAATLYGEHSGLFGDAGVYSFYSTKAIPGGEGGVVITNNEEIGDQISRFSIYDRFDQKLELGNNIRASEIQALFLYSTVKEWKKIIENKQVIANKYISACKQNGINFISQNTNGHYGNYYKFIVYDNNNLVSELYPNLKTLTSPVYDYAINSKNSVAGHHICLPIWYKQEIEITNKVVQEINS